MSSDNAGKPCQYVGCESNADVYVKVSSTNLCGEHYTLNVLRMGCVPEYKPLNDSVQSWADYSSEHKER